MCVCVFYRFTTRCYRENNKTSKFLYKNKKTYYSDAHQMRILMQPYNWFLPSVAAPCAVEKFGLGGETRAIYRVELMVNQTYPSFTPSFHPRVSVVLLCYYKATMDRGFSTSYYVAFRYVSQYKYPWNDSKVINQTFRTRSALLLLTPLTRMDIFSFFFVLSLFLSHTHSLCLSVLTGLMCSSSCNWHNLPGIIVCGRIDRSMQIKDSP